MTSSYRAALIAMGVAGLAACTGGSQVVYATGTCQTQNERCNARCERLGDARECVESCLLDARLCMKAQGSGGARVFGGASEPPRISEHKALLVDFSGERPRASPELTVELTGTVEALDGVHRLQPGGGVGVRFLLPEDLREAEVLIEHAPGGDGTDCFVTITVGSHALASRYAPPRTKGGELRTETWNLTPLIETLRAEQEGAQADKPAGAQEKQPLVLFIYNNQAAGSRAPYRLGTVQLLYRTLALPSGARPDSAGGDGRSNSSFTAPR